MKRQISSSEIEQIKQQLEQDIQDIQRRLSEHEDTGELSLYDNHPGDTGTELYENEKDLALRDHAEKQLENTKLALSMIASGGYGICKVCSQSIEPDRLQAVPTTLYCKQHADGLSTSGDNEQVSNYRPVEEDFLQPPFGRTSMDEASDDGNDPVEAQSDEAEADTEKRGKYRHLDDDEGIHAGTGADGQTGFDGEDAWQIVERWGNSDSPAMAEEPDVNDYNGMFIESDEPDGYVEDIESFLATDIYGSSHLVIRNREFERYMHSEEGDHFLEEDE